MTDSKSISALTEEWKKLSTPWIKEAREGRNPTREGLLDPPMIKACGDVAGLRILDCGCGEGRFCRKLSELGAEYVLGIDLCEPMIKSAKELPMKGVEYKIEDAQNLDFLEDNSLDLVISYLNQCDLPDVDANNREVFRVLKTKGRFIIANIHPMRSASKIGGWIKNDDGTKDHVILDDYLDEGERTWKMMNCEFTNFHRTLETYLDSFNAAGFKLEKLIERSLSIGMLNDYPELDDELRVPNFIIYVLRK